MDWIQTWTGKPFRPLQPEPGSIDVRDIAHSLSLLCRFNGHCRCFYSVAEHSVRLSRIVPPEHALWGLLHDAAEAYISDLPRPVKQQIPAFTLFEDNLLELIMAHFGLGWPMPAAVKEADDRMLATEARDLMARPPDVWGHQVAPLPETIIPQDPPAAEAAFLERFRELTS
ncbi:MAG: phosphohydrolase [Pseudomonadota bacterium]